MATHLIFSKQWAKVYEEEPETSAAVITACPQAAMKVKGTPIQGVWQRRTKGKPKFVVRNFPHPQCKGIS
ncbi:hypothetical protein, partial [Streptococcus pseudopneumoniae]